MVHSNSMSTSRMLRFGCLLLVAAVASGPAQVRAESVSLASPDMCKFPFKYGNVYFNTCTTLGNNGIPWCMLKDSYKPAPPSNDWAACDMSQFEPLKAVVDGVVRECVPQVDRNLTFTGCSKQLETDKAFMCNTTIGEPGECLSADSALNNKKAGGKLQAKVPLSGDAANGGTTSAAGGISTAAIGGICASVCAVALLAGLFVYRRRQSSKEAGSAYMTGVSAKGVEMNGVQGAGFATTGAAATAGYRDSTASSQMFSPVNPGDRVYPVVSTYTPTLGDELEIQPGDTVSILIEYDDGWCQGINHSRGGSKGVFPRHCVDMSAGVPISEQSSTPGASATSLQ